MKTMRTLILSAALALLGAGCLPVRQAPPSAPAAAPAEATPYVNEANCRNSGGTVDGDACDCPGLYAPDPAGFCLDPQGRPGGSMAPKS